MSMKNHFFGKTPEKKNVRQRDQTPTFTSYPAWLAKPRIPIFLVVWIWEGQDIYGERETITGPISQVKVRQNRVLNPQLVLTENGKRLMQIVQAQSQRQGLGDLILQEVCIHAKAAGHFPA